MRYSVMDDQGRTVSLRRPPRRVVSLVPSVTELVCELGAADRLVAVTRYCTHPPEVVARLPRVGGTKNPACDEIVALEPDVVLLNCEENRREDFEHLSAAGIPLFVSFATTVEEAARSVERLGVLLDAERTAREAAMAIDQAREAARNAVRNRARVFCPIWRNPWMGFNRETFAHDLLWCAGGENVCASAAERYPQVSLEEIAACAPDVILLPSEPYRFSEKHISSLEPLCETPAWRNERIYLVDGQALSWYGPRTAAALSYFADFLIAPVSSV